METLARAANRGSISTGYDVDNSLKFEADNTEYMHYTPSGQTDYERMAFSVWVKRTELSTAQLIMEFGNGTANTSNLRIGFDTSDRLFCYGNSITWRQTNQVFRDTSAWYHLFFLFDTTTPGGISNNRIRIWVNGSMIAHTDFGVINNPGSGAAMGFNNSLKQSLGRQTEDATSYFCGYMAQVYGSGGTPPVVGDFGETDSNTGIWIPKDISEITPPDEAGFNLDFSDAGNLGNDISSRNNDFTLVNIAAADQATDTCTNNFCTLNPLLTNAGSANYLTMTEGATKGVNAGNAYRLAVASMGVTSGKWYWEVKATSASNIMYMGITYPSIWDTDYTLGGTIFLDDNNDPVRYNNDSRSSFGSAFGNGDIIAFALDMDATPPTMTVYKNNSSLGNLMTGLSINGAGGAFLPPKENGYFPKIGGYGAATWECNFGGYTSATPSSAETDENGYGTFEYAPPSGYYALCTKNLAEYG
jgi:hypothetical protein